MYIHDIAEGALLMNTLKRREHASSVCSCINLRRAAHAITEYYDDVLQSSGLTLNQYFLLKNMKRLGICSTSELARQVRLERTTLVRTIRPLFQKGYLEDVSSKDTRKRQIRVTSDGLQILGICEPLWEKAQNGIVSTLGSENVYILMELLAKIESLNRIDVNKYVH